MKNSSLTSSSSSTFFILSFFALSFFFSSLTCAQRTELHGNIERSIDDDELQLYVTGSVGIKRIEVEKGGTFSVATDLFVPARCILFWKGRVAEDWSFAFWLLPDSTSTVSLKVQKEKKTVHPVISFVGAAAARSVYANLYYQTFERQNLLDDSHLSSLPDFRSCQEYVRKTLEPLGEALLNITDADFNEEEYGDDDDDEDDDKAMEEDEKDAPLSISSSFCNLQREELDVRCDDAEFAYAVLAEHRGQKMEADAAFMERLAELDSTDVEQAYAIALMTGWDAQAHPERYVPLTDEAAQLRSLSLFTSDQDVRNAAAEYIMQHFFLRVQMGQADPSSPSCRPLYEELRRVSTDDNYEEFIETQLQMMDRPDLFEEDKDEEESEESEDGVENL